jgi:hypothetical protein
VAELPQNTNTAYRGSWKEAVFRTSRDVQCLKEVSKYQQDWVDTRSSSPALMSFAFSLSQSSSTALPAVFEVTTNQLLYVSCIIGKELLILCIAYQNYAPIHCPKPVFLADLGSGQ